MLSDFVEQVFSLLVTGLIFSAIWLLVHSVFRDLRRASALHRTPEQLVALWSLTMAEERTQPNGNLSTQSHLNM